MRVKNVNGTSHEVCSCGNWLQHWLNYSKRPLPRFCSELRCLQRPTVGACVQKEWALDGKWYVTPLCASHSARTGQTLELAFSAVLVPADPSETCGRWLPQPSL